MANLNDELIKILKTGLEEITDLVNVNATYAAIGNRAKSALKEYYSTIHAAIEAQEQKHKQE